jgi:hypothetical protein
MDGGTYLHFFPTSTFLVRSSLDEIGRKIADGFDVVHLLTNFNAEGALFDDRGLSADAGWLLRTCEASGVKLLWIAGSVPRNACHKFKVRRGDLDLVLTVDRRGPRFDEFLRRFLAGIASGLTVPKAWVGVAPQTSESPQNRQGPLSILAVGLGDYVLAGGPYVQEK